MIDGELQSFVLAVESCVEHVLGATVTPQPPTPLPSPSMPRPKGVISAIGFSGDRAGQCLLHLPSDTATALAERMLGNEFQSVTPAVRDACGRVLEHIAAEARAILAADHGIHLNFALALTLANTPVEIALGPADVHRVPFESSLGPFALLITHEVFASEGSTLP